MTRDSEADRSAELIDFYTPLLLRMCVAAGVIAAFAREERSPEDVAVSTNTHPAALARVLRALASRGLFEECGGGRYRLTVLGRRFLPDEPASIAGLANFKLGRFTHGPRRITP